MRTRGKMFWECDFLQKAIMYLWLKSYGGGQYHQSCRPCKFYKKLNSLDDFPQ